MSYTCTFDINEITQELLRVARHQFNENVRLEENVTSPEIQHSDCGPLTCSQIDWQSYLRYPFILWDPVAQFPYLFNTRSFLCPICLEDADTTDMKAFSFLSRTNHWFNGRLKRYNPLPFFIHGFFIHGFFISMILTAVFSLLGGWQRGVVIPFHAQILTKFTRHVLNQSLLEKPQGNEVFTTKRK